MTICCQAVNCGSKPRGEVLVTEGLSFEESRVTPHGVAGASSHQIPSREILQPH